MDIGELHGWYVYSDQSLNWVFENLELQAKVGYLIIRVNALSLSHCMGVLQSLIMQCSFLPILDIFAS